MGVALPNAPRIASPSFDRSVGLDVLAIGVIGFALTLAVPALGARFLFPAIVIAFLVSFRRRTVGAYEGEQGLVIRNFTRTVEVPWSTAEAVITERDPWLPWMKVAVVRRAGEGTVPVSGLRFTGEPPAPVMTLTRIVRDRREHRSREVW